MKQLFEGRLLYSTGRPRSFYRGKVHLLSSLFVFPAVLYCFARASWHNSYVFRVGMLSAGLMYAAHAVSAVYHTFPVDENLEKILQKMDYIGANLYAGSSFLPMALLSFPEAPGQLFAALLMVVAGWNCVDVWNSWYSTTRPVFIIALHFLFVYYLFTALTWFEIGMMYAAIGLMYVGLTFLIYTPNSSLSKDVSFEIYHLITVLCYACVLMMNYSIVKRKMGN
jgi:hypothetical protein